MVRDTLDIWLASLIKDGTLCVISAPIQSVLYAVSTKSVGAFYRIKDDWRAPAGVRNRTIQREAVQLSLVTLLTTGIQMLFTTTLKGFLQKNPALANCELLLRALATIPAMALAETMSRKLAPKPTWRQSSMKLGAEKSDVKKLSSGTASRNPFVVSAVPRPISAASSGVAVRPRQQVSTSVPFMRTLQPAFEAAAHQVIYRA